MDILSGYYKTVQNLFSIHVFHMREMKHLMLTTITTVLLLHLMLKILRTTLKLWKILQLILWILLWHLQMKKFLQNDLLKNLQLLALKKMKLRVLLTKHGMNLLLHVMTWWKRVKKLLNIWKKQDVEVLFLPVVHTTLILKSTTVFLKWLTHMVLLFLQKIQFHILLMLKDL